METTQARHLPHAHRRARCPPAQPLSKWRDLNVVRPLSEARDAGENLIGAFGPNKGVRIRVMLSNEFADRSVK